MTEQELEKLSNLQSEIRYLEEKTRILGNKFREARTEMASQAEQPDTPDKKEKYFVYYQNVFGVGGQIAFDSLGEVEKYLAGLNPLTLYVKVVKGRELSVKRKLVKSEHEAINGVWAVENAKCER